MIGKFGEEHYDLVKKLAAKHGQTAIDHAFENGKIKIGHHNANTNRTSWEKY